YITNGHGVWEASNTNMFSRSDRALLAATGRFCHGWAEAARRMGVAVDMIDFGKSSPADPQRIADALPPPDTAHQIKAILVTHVDIASNARNDLAAIHAAIDNVGHPALLAVDAIASLACDQLHMDDWGIDVLVAASQKGLMLPCPRPVFCLIFRQGAGGLSTRRSRHPLLELEATRAGHRVLAIFRRHRPDPPSLWSAKGADHDPG
ncbi:MAG: aminotransferase class V-fold PLP-dependent enzyme, partial [Candidatus Devosia symbiotica]|nr:aminotransferase class V-fold PLP-dependent enzyme [Candidatus Devosia symbiotica]